MNYFSSQKADSDSDISSINSRSSDNILLKYMSKSLTTNENKNEKNIGELLENLENPGVIRKISNTFGNIYNGTKSSIYNLYTGVRDRELISDRKLKDRADRLEIKSHELVKINHHRRLNLVNYLTAMNLFGYLVLGIIVVSGNSKLQIDRPRTNIYKSYPWSNLNMAYDYRKNKN